MLRKVKKKIEYEFTETINNNVKEYVGEIKESKPKKVIAKADKKFEKKDKSDAKVSRKTSTKKTVAKK